jgi:hypothetical protein
MRSILGGALVLLGIGGVDAIHAGPLQDHIGLDLDGAQAGCGIRGEIGLPVPAPKITMRPFSK